MRDGIKAGLILLGTTALFILFLILCPPKAPAGEIHGNFEIGKDTDVPEAYAEIELSFDFDLWVFQNSVYGGWLTWMTLPAEGLTMDGIVYDLYTIGYRIAYEDIYLQIEHYCRHPELMDTSDESKSTITIGIRW